MTTKLKPCPFCGATEEYLKVRDKWVECLCCTAEGPYSRSAVAQWNNRTKPKTLPAILVCCKAHPRLTVGRSYPAVMSNPNPLNSMVVNDKGCPEYFPTREFFQTGGE